MRPRILSLHLCVLAALLGPFAAFSSAQDDPRGVRLLNAREELLLVNTVQGQREQLNRNLDCSHLVHQIYALSGFPYPYASSYDLYEGVDNFRRVSRPRPGDLVVWQGHVGIVTDPVEKTFFSSVTSGPRTENYEARYWRAQGRPRFYRYFLSNAAQLTLANASVPANRAVRQTNDRTKTQTKEPIVPEDYEIAGVLPIKANLPASAEPPPISLSPSSPLNYTLALASSIRIGPATIKPTDDDVAEAFSQFNGAAGNVLQDWPSSNPKRIVFIYDQLRVERIQLKRDRGWVSAEVEGRLSIGDNGLEGKRRTEKLRWELRRTPQGWQLLAPANRAYVPRDVAVRVLAGQLASLTQDEEASDNLDRSMHEQSVIVRALGLLFETN
jgi:NlpC/P60 family